MGKTDQDEAAIFAEALEDDIALPEEAPAAEPEAAPEPEAKAEETPPEAEAEAPQAEAEAPEASETVQSQPEAEAEAPADETPAMPENVPSWRLAEEANKRREAEAQNQQLADAVRSLQTQIYQMAGQQPQQAPQGQGGQGQPQQRPQVDVGIDPIEDPAGYAAAVIAQANAVASQNFNHQLQVVRLENSLARAADRHGDALNQAYDAFMGTAGNDQATYVRVMNSPDPGEAMVRWHREQSLLQETGGDPSAYRAKMREELLNDPEFRKSMMETLQAEAQSSPNPNTVTQIPPSLASVPGGSSPHKGEVQTTTDDAGMFKDAFSGL